jgi:hypothetical protein
MNTFDAPSRSFCLVQRQQTSTPLQALVLLNDPQFVEAAKVVSERVFKKHFHVKSQVTYMYQLLTGHQPTAKEVPILIKLYQKEYEKFKQHPEKMTGWLKAGEYMLAQHDKAALAAGTVVASTIMNSDAFITKR